MILWLVLLGLPYALGGIFINPIVPIEIPWTFPEITFSGTLPVPTDSSPVKVDHLLISVASSNINASEDKSSAQDFEQRYSLNELHLKHEQNVSFDFLRGTGWFC